MRWPVVTALTTIRRHAPRVTFVALICLVLGASSAAFATAGEHEGWLGVDADAAPRAGVSARYRYAWTDFWAVGMTLQHRIRVGEALDLARMQTAAFADVRVTLDALTWAPSVVVGLGGVTEWEGTVAPAAHAAAVLAYRPARDWSLQLCIGVDQPLADGAPQFFVSVSFGWIRGAAGGLDF